MEEKLNRRPHKLEVTGRGTGSVTGIQDVVSFDENQIILDTDMGLLTVKGKSLHVSRLTLEKGEVDIEGRSTALPIPPMRITANQENPCLTGCSNNKKRRAKMG